MRALVIAPQPFFSPRGTPFSVYYRTLVMSEAGVQVDLLTYGCGQDVDLPNVRVVRIPNLRGFREVKIGPSFKKLVLDAFLVAWTVGLLLRRRYAFVHAHEEAVFFCTALKPLFRFRMIYDMHSSLPQQLTNFQFTTRRWLIGLFRRLEDWSLRRADAVITICPDLADYAVERLGPAAADRHVLIENSIFDPVRLKQPAAAAGAAPEAAIPMEPGARWVVYAGTMEPYQGMEIAIRAFPQVTARAPDARLLLLGGTAEQVARYRALAESVGAGDTVRLYPRMPQAAAVACLDRAAVQLSPRSAGTNTPLKIYQQLASGIPLVATRIHSHTQVLDAAVAYLVDPTPEAMAGGILQALADGRDGNPRAAAARELYNDRYARPIYERKLRAVLERVTACAG